MTNRLDLPVCVCLIPNADFLIAAGGTSDCSVVSERGIQSRSCSRQHATSYRSITLRINAAVGMLSICYERSNKDDCENRNRGGLGSLSKTHFLSIDLDLTSILWYGSHMNDYLSRTDTFMASLGLETYRVGGSVRDEILGRRVKDADYMVRGTDMRTLGAKLAFAKGPLGNHQSPVVKPLKLRDGRQAGWRVSARGLGCIEIVLPRTEVSTGPGHRDFEILVDHELPLIDDAIRRDFTFNALYKIVSHPENLHITTQITGAEIIDILDPTEHGLHDLQRRFVRTTHPDSFRDDPLRTLRALRFVSVLGYDLAESTRAEMREHANAVTGLTMKGTSGTVLDELSKLLMGDNAVAALREARDTGVLAVVLPELAPMIGFDQGSRYHDMTTDEHTFKALETAVHVDAPLRVRMALLFHDSGKPATAWIGDDGRKHYYAQKPKNELIDPHDGHLNLDHEEQSEYLWNEAATRLNAPKALRTEVATLVRDHMVTIRPKAKATVVNRARVKYGDEMLKDLYMHRVCDLSGKGAKVALNHITHIGTLEQIRQRSQDAGVPAGYKDLQINGKDAIELGLHGKEISTALARVLDEVVCQPEGEKLTREWQLAALARKS